MSQSAHLWALILAAGEGDHPEALASEPCGTAVPRQFCSLRGDRTPLEDAIARARALVDAERVCAIVAQQHRQWWTEIAALERLVPGCLPGGNLIVQPRNRGNTIAILYSLLHVLACDPQARVVILPADPHGRDEPVLRREMLRALRAVEAEPQYPVLLGMQPGACDPEPGCSLSEAREATGGRAGTRLGEPSVAGAAGELASPDGPWNMFILAARAAALVELFMPRHASLVMEMQVTLARNLACGSPAAGWPAIVDLYERLPALDFSRDLLEGREGALRVQRVPTRGGSDLADARARAQRTGLRRAGLHEGVVQGERVEVGACPG